jgi:hypothetical protein
MMTGTNQFRQPYCFLGSTTWRRKLNLGFPHSDGKWYRLWQCMNGKEIGQCGNDLWWYMDSWSGDGTRAISKTACEFSAQIAKTS